MNDTDMLLKKDHSHSIDRSFTRDSQTHPKLFGLANHWYLLKILTLSDLKAQHIGSVLGGLWFVVHPLVLIGIYTIVFSTAVTAVSAFDDGPINYGLFIFAGMLPWLGVQNSIQRGATIMVDLAQLIRHHTLPLGLLPLHVVLSVTLSQIIAVLVFLAIKLSLSAKIPLLAPLILLVIPLQIVFCFGLALIVGILNVFLRDISHLTTAGMLVWFFASPIVFPLESFSGFLRNIMWLNPMTGLTQIYRDLLLLGRIPSAMAVGSLVFFALGVVLVGTRLYRRTHHAVVDWI
jgi:lipopolysaccharide transport system permease protein